MLGIFVLNLFALCILTHAVCSIRINPFYLLCLSRRMSSALFLDAGSKEGSRRHNPSASRFQCRTRRTDSDAHATNSKGTLV